MKQCVRNIMVEINRFSELSECMFVSRQAMLDNLWTLKLVNQNLNRINGFEWMKDDNEFSSQIHKCSQTE